MWGSELREELGELPAAAHFPEEGVGLSGWTGDYLQSPPPITSFVSVAPMV